MGTVDLPPITCALAIMGLMFFAGKGLTTEERLLEFFDGLHAPWYTCPPGTIEHLGSVCYVKTNETITIVQHTVNSLTLPVHVVALENAYFESRRDLLPPAIMFFCACAVVCMVELCCCFARKEKVVEEGV